MSKEEVLAELKTNLASKQEQDGRNKEEYGELLRELYEQVQDNRITALQAADYALRVGLKIEVWSQSADLGRNGIAVNASFKILIP